MLACCLPVCAQEPAPAGHAPTLQVQSQLVVLDTVVTDSKGNVVRGLTKDDFVVYENGVRQTIRSFTTNAEQPPVPATPHVDRNGNDDWGNAPLTIIVVDEMDTPFEEMAYSREEVRNYLKKQPAELATPTILLWLNDYGIHPLTKFTRDRDAILTAVQKQPPSLPSKLSRGAVAEQVASSLAALQQAALFSRGEPGKKLMVWIGRSFPSVDPSSDKFTDYDAMLLSKAIKSTADLLLQSRVTLYVVDPTLRTSTMNDQSGDDSDAVQLPSGGTVKDPFASVFNMSLFVNETGGMYFRGRNDLDQEVADAETRALTYYTLSYVPSQAIQPGAYRKIDIRFTRPGLHAQAKQGYYSEEPTPVAPPTKLEAKLEESDLKFDLYEAAVTGMQYTGLGLHVIRCAKDGGRPVTNCVVSIDTGTLTFAPYNEQEERSTFMTVVASMDAKGKLVNDTIAKLTVAVPENQAAQIGTGATQVELHTIVPLGTKSVRVVVRDESGRIGTADVPVKMVPSLVATGVDARSVRKK